MRRAVVTLLFSLASFVVVGCGEKPLPVNGVVNLDGKPVEGATVTFSTEDGKRSYGGFTDANGAFTLSNGTVPGALPGSYKVTITKSKKIEGGDSMEAGGSDYFKQMEKMSKENKASGGGAGNPMMKGAGGMMPGKMMPGGGSGSAAPPKSELPSLYATSKSTPFNITIPSSTNPIVLDLKSKP